MPDALTLKFHPLLSKHCVFLNSATNSSSFHPSPILSCRTQIHHPVICARKSQRGSGHQKLAKILPKLAFSVVSNLKVLPELLDLILAEFSSGDGGAGSGSWKGFGGGGRSDGWGRRGRRNSRILFGIFLVCGVAILLFLSGAETNKDLIFGILASGLLAAIVVEGFPRGARDWFLGFCIFGVGVALGLRRDDLQKWVQRHGITSPILQLRKGKRRTSLRLW